jgi:hypothetical protein
MADDQYDLHVRERVGQATDIERAKLFEALELKPLRGGAALERRIEVAFFDVLDRARPKVAAGPLTYGAALAASAVAMTPPKTAEIISDFKEVGRLLASMFGSDSDQAPPQAANQGEALQVMERRLLQQVLRVPVDAKGPRPDPLRAGLKLGGPAALGILSPTLGLASFAWLKLSGAWDAHALAQLVNASVLLASVGERLRLEAVALGDPQ